MNIFFAGFITGFSLIVAIGAQNAYLLRLGLTRQHVRLAVAICVSSDVILIALGTASIGAVVRAEPRILTICKWIGVVYLVCFAAYSFWRASKTEILLPSDMPTPSRKLVASTMLAFTLLNPHVYLDTVLLLGSLSNQYGAHRWFFAGGACLASLLWFSLLGFGARAASRLMSRVVTWRILDALIGCIMILVAYSIATTHLGS